MRSCYHLVEQVVEGLAVLEPPRGGELPRLLADGAVGLLEERGHLGQRPLLAAIGDGHRPHDLLILLLQLGELGLARDVRLAEQVAAILQRAVEDEVAVARQLQRGAASRGIGSRISFWIGLSFGSMSRTNAR